MEVTAKVKRLNKWNAMNSRARLGVNGKVGLIAQLHVVRERRPACERAMAISA